MAVTPSTQNIPRGLRISALITRTDKRDYQIADSCGISPPQLSKIKQGAGFSLDVLEKLTYELQTTSDFILTGLEPLPGFNRLDNKSKIAVLTLIENLAD